MLYNDRIEQIYLFKTQHFIEQRRQEHQIDASERLLRVGDLTGVLQRVLN